MRDRQASALEPVYTDLTYQPMLEVMHYLHDNGYKTYIVTGGGQDFVRVYSERVYGIPRAPCRPAAGGRRKIRLQGRKAFSQGAETAPERQLCGEAGGHHLEIGARSSRLGNSTSNREMWMHTRGLLVLHDDAAREYAYETAEGYENRDIHSGAYDEAKKDGWQVISMKHDWKRIFRFRADNKA